MKNYSDVNEISHSKKIISLFVLVRTGPIWRDLKEETQGFGTASEKKRH